MKNEKEFTVEVTATVVKVIRVMARDEDSAMQKANDQFNPNSDGTEERYEQSAKVL